MVTVHRTEIEGEIGEPLGAALGDGVAQRVQMRNATVIGNRDLPVQNHCRQSRAVAEGQNPSNSAVTSGQDEGRLGANLAIKRQ